MSDIHKIIRSLAGLGEVFGRVSSGKSPDLSDSPACQILRKEMGEGVLYNPWFIEEFTRFACKAWSEALTLEKAETWLSPYSIPEKRPANPLTVAIIMAGNVPMVGLHDLICVLASGHNALIRLSSQDDRLIPAVIRLLSESDPGISERIRLERDKLKGFDAVIATGSNNTYRYFDYYFGGYPHIIRKNRNSIAVLTGRESPQETGALAMDIFSYFGKGCRNVSKLYLPQNFDPASLWPAFESFSFLGDHSKYRNNYDYQKSILIINRISHFDNGFTLLTEDRNLNSPVSVLHFERYDDPEAVNEQLIEQRDLLQCIISGDDSIRHSIPFGRSQFPELWDYADGIDVMQFLQDLAKGQSEIKNSELKNKN